jgi:hypothetical protein
MSFARQIQHPEKRKELRQKCEIWIECSYFNRVTHFEAKLLNFSKGGVYLETDHELKPGCTIFMKLLRISPNSFPSPVNEYPRSVTLGEVKWRIDLSRSESAYYGAGLRYPFPS